MATNAHRPRTLVLCFDGTSNEFDGDNTNVVKFYSLLKKDDPARQMVYYQAGIGTYAKPGFLSPVSRWFARVVDTAIAWFLDAHVIGGYEFLMQNYQPGDKICMLGFSRGAYTVRALAGMLHKVGLLPKDNFAQVPFAYKMYTRMDKKGFELSQAFRRTFSRAVEIEFIGLWDTVSSVGTLRPRRLPFTSSNSIVRTFRHALALDERRARFRPTLWSHPKTVDTHPMQSVPNTPAPPVSRSLPETPVPPTVHILGSRESIGGHSPPKSTHIPLPPSGHASASSPPPASEAAPLSPVSPVSPISNLLTRRFNSLKNKPLPGGLLFVTEKQDGHEREHEPQSPAGDLAEPRARGMPLSRKAARELLEAEGTLEREFDKDVRGNSTEWRAHAGTPSLEHRADVLEVWFAGSHSDVGGGYDLDEAPHQLSNVSLQWMIREAVLAQAGLLFDHAALKRAGMRLGALGLASPAMRTHELRASSPPLESLHMPRSKRDLSPHAGVSEDASMVATQLRPPRAPSSSSLGLDPYGPDALRPVHDELALSPHWWVLELLPSEHWYQDARGGWCRTTRPNMGRSRKIPDERPNLHHSVRVRMEHKEMRYTPKARWVGEPNWVL